MRSFALLCAASVVVAGAIACSAPALAFTAPISVTEDSVLGYVGDYPTSDPAIKIGSDGESPFDPFGYGQDTSDGIVLNTNWTQIAGFNSWVNIGNDTYVIPACVSGVCENGPVPEEIGVWVFANTSWADFTPAAVNMWEGRELSDVVSVWNANGNAYISFNSITAPEPATWALIAIGFAGLGFASRRKMRSQPAVA